MYLCTQNLFNCNKISNFLELFSKKQQQERANFISIFIPKEKSNWVNNKEQSNMND